MYISKNHSRYSLKVHIIFVVKYQKKLLDADMSFFIKRQFIQTAEHSDFSIELMETDKDHIHLLINYEPKISVLSIVRRLKQESTIAVWKLYGSRLRRSFWKERTFWSDGYFAASIGEGTSYETIQEYIKSQG